MQISEPMLYFVARRSYVSAVIDRLRKVPVGDQDSQILDEYPTTDDLTAIAVGALGSGAETM
jgi:hypothetical protein